ncbi:MAG TPA: phosphate/phosphite/phosphonate ABC transporter substrate-binding protein [Streptomyces sp.]|jgi:ABC-type phosphate/phosphonate transport system substrate-binding protein|nr:phosphate/phosphite/phosphonate ABC transporter substrate-binding protein [Streptomyces sp.]
MTLLMGAVAYDPKVVTIWAGFRTWLARQDFDLDFVLYSHYERQVEDLVDGRLHAAWHSPLAWVRTRRLARARGYAVRPGVMRDTDQDLRSLVVVREDSALHTPADLKGETVAVGAVDSPQATLLPLSLLRDCGLQPGEDFTVLRHQVGVGLHGDHVGGERDAVRALVQGEVAAACVTDGNHLQFTREGTLGGVRTRVLARTEPYDHCVMAYGETAPAAATDRLDELLLSMSYADPEVRPLLDLEGLTSWRPGRETGYGCLERAVDESGFYDESGSVTAAHYVP